MDAFVQTNHDKTGDICLSWVRVKSRQANAGLFGPMGAAMT